MHDNPRIQTYIYWYLMAFFSFAMKDIKGKLLNF